MDTPIEKMLAETAKNAKLRFCMPGHKGALQDTDLTEIGGIGDSHAPSGPFLTAQKELARAFCAKRAFFSTNGSTAGVTALLCAAAKEGEKVILARDAHRSAASALCIGGQIPVYVQTQAPPLCARTEDFLKAIEDNPGARAVFVTYPNYYGACCDIARIKRACDVAGMLLIADSAHGAHFGFADGLPQRPDTADGWVAGAHKTLCAYSSSAFVFMGKESKLSEAALIWWLGAVTTSSPYWPMLAQMDKARAALQKGAREDYALLIRRIDAFYGSLPEGICPLISYPGFAKDPTRVVLDVSGAGYSGFEAAKGLEARGIFCEAADARRLVLICTPQDKAEDFAALSDALLRLGQGDGAFPAEPAPPAFCPGVSPRKARYGKITLCPMEKSAGTISAGAVGAYPPGTAAIMPGDRITQSQTDYILAMRRSGASIFGALEGEEGLKLEISE